MKRNSAIDLVTCLCAACRLAAVAVLIASFIVCALIARIVHYGDTARRRSTVRLTAWFIRRLLRLLNITVISRAPIPVSFNGLLVSNHVSYLDVLVLYALHPSVFVTSVEIQRSFFLGSMAALGGAVFIERRSRAFLAHEIAKLSSVVQSGFSVTVFPEGTTGNGSGVLPFKTPLLEAARMTGRDILPVCISYVSIDGEPVTERNRDGVCWYGDMGFFPHFMRLLTVRAITVEVMPLAVRTLDAAACRKETGAAIRSALDSAYRGRLVGITARA